MQKISDQNCTLFKNTYYKSHKSSFVPKKDFEVGEDLRSYLRSIEKEILSKDNWTKRFIKFHFWSGFTTYRMCANLTRCLYILKPPFEGQINGLFLFRILALCMVSVQEQFIIKSRLWWHACVRFFRVQWIECFDVTDSW